ncbi:DNA cytosine methyltransferase [Novosphingobium guangzhouense]|nr:DNA cytosine methyltransferase [Novosphingobium guangzhouense]
MMAAASAVLSPLGAATAALGIWVDGFAGGGGASTGIAAAIGRDVDIAINHDPRAIAIHRANHATTEHHCQDIKITWPLAATRFRPVWGAWFSPDCKEHSKAKGGPVKNRNIRQLPDEILPWLRDTRPKMCFVENVEEMQQWGPLDEGGRIIPELKGKEFQRWIRAIRVLGYRVQWRELRACDYGTPTSRKRLYIVMRSDGKPIVWPKPTHAPANDNRVIKSKLLPYRTAAECIDWSIPCPSIFDRDRGLAENTNRRVAHGVMRHVVEAADPFIVPVTNSKWNPSRTWTTREPLRTITTAKGGEYALVDAAAISLEKFAENSRGKSVAEPLDAVMAGAPRHAQVAAFLTHFRGSNRTASGGDIRMPAKTVTSGGQHQAIVCAHIEQANGGPRNVNSTGRSAARPLSTITTRGTQQRVVETTLIEEGDLPPAMMERAVKVAAFLVKYYGSATSQSVEKPFDTITTLPRYAVVTVTIDAVTYVIVDIGLRMLTPRELARAQGFPDSYVLDPIVRQFIRGKWIEQRLSKAAQIRMIGNSVCPPVAEALIRANMASDLAQYPGVLAA